MKGSQAKVPAIAMKNSQHHHPSALCVLQASLAYFGIGVGTAIVLDTTRRMTVEPRFGKLIAVLVELPFLLSVCWWGSFWSTARFGLISGKVIEHRLIMCFISFSLFCLVEMIMSYFFLKQTLPEFCVDYVKSYSPANPANLLGRIGEGLYGVIPLVQGIMQEQSRTARKKA
jgi:hypothetical protein